tara:strand:+ start:4673 stop:4891 length:219 start_codon:yes stop_codon:yes gene_type:complete
MEKTNNFRNVENNSQKIEKLQNDVKNIQEYIKTSVKIEQLLQISGFNNKLNDAKVKKATDLVQGMISKNKGK